MSILRKIFYSSIICFLLSFSNCTTETAKTYNTNAAPLLISAFDADQNDITSVGDVGMVRLYIYDEQKDLIEWLDISSEDVIKRKEIKISYPSHKYVYIEAVNLSSNKQIIYPEWKHFLDEFSVTYSAVEEMEHAKQIFIGSSIYDNRIETSGPHIVKLNRTVGKMRVALKGQKRDASNYNVRISRISAQINAEKKGFDERLELVSSFKVKDNEVTTDYYAMFPSEHDSGIMIDIYDGDTLLHSFDKDKTGQFLRNAIDKVLNIQIDLASLSTQVIVNPWINEEVDIEI
ncbi:MAG: FimB/Mfa2 family fimbrial subunit [Bacteroidales bacterium]